MHSFRVFLDLAENFRAFIKNYATKTKCLIVLKQKDVSFKWSEECEEAYQLLVTTISSDPVFKLPDFDLPFELTTDASNYETADVLYQKILSVAINQQLNVIGYYSYTFDKAQENYPTTDKEALAMVMALRYFNSYLEGRTLRQIFTVAEKAGLLRKLSVNNGFFGDDRKRHFC